MMTSYVILISLANVNHWHRYRLLPVSCFAGCQKCHHQPWIDNRAFCCQFPQQTPRPSTKNPLNGFKSPEEELVTPSIAKFSKKFLKIFLGLGVLLFLCLLFVFLKSWYNFVMLYSSSNNQWGFISSYERVCSRMNANAIIEAKNSLNECNKKPQG